MFSHSLGKAFIPEVSGPVLVFANDDLGAHVVEYGLSLPGSLLESCMIHSHNVLAGMPSITLTEITKLRLDAISFFLVGVLLSAWGVQTLWNLLSRDIAKLPHIRYSTSLTGIILWGLLFMLVLTMISGARELMTPGAWGKVGYTYELTEQEEFETPKSSQLLAERRERLELLRTMLWAHRAVNEGRFPESIESSGIAAELWKQPGAEVATYQYDSAANESSEPIPLVTEYMVYDGAAQFVLMSDGAIRELIPDADTQAENQSKKQEPSQ